MALKLEQDGKRFRVLSQEYCTEWLPDTPSNRKSVVVFLRLLTDTPFYQLVNDPLMLLMVVNDPLMLLMVVNDPLMLLMVVKDPLTLLMGGESVKMEPEMAENEGPQCLAA